MSESREFDEGWRLAEREGIESKRQQMVALIRGYNIVMRRNLRFFREGKIGWETVAAKRPPRYLIDYYWELAVCRT